MPLSLTLLVATCESSLMDEAEKLYSLRYVGRRFDGARLPLDVLSDLLALRDLIAAFAKLEFRHKNPDRKRVPQGFDRSISFALIRIEPGSAVPVFALDYEAAQQNLPNIGDGMEDIVSRAYAQVGKIFDDAAHDRFPSALPEDAIRALSKLGANIQEDERIDLLGTSDADGNVVCLDAFRRKNLLTRVRETYTIEYEGVGTLTGIDLTQNTIQVKTEKYGEFRLPLDGVSLPAEQFDGSLNTLVEFSVSVELDAHDELRGIEDVRSVDLVRPYDNDVMRCIVRLQELSQVEKGWLGDEHGEQIVHLAAMRATQLIFSRAELASQFRLFPTEDGGVSIEFERGSSSFAVEVTPDGSLEIDGVSADGTVFEPRKFVSFSSEFFEAFDAMTSVTAHEED